MDQKPSPREMGYSLAIAQTGVEMVLPTILGFYLDSWLETTPWITIVAAVLGFTAGLVHLIAILRQKDRDESSDMKPPP
ncbi:MAG: AtpZ/AtpI family protein [Gemmataceae bacterium]|nr:AtpZ/AtpI family protein [Gemmataceae bacterium]